MGTNRFDDEPKHRRILRDFGHNPPKQKLSSPDTDTFGKQV